MEDAGSATILHADLDAFYASVEQLDRPELRGKPIAVGGGVILAASYEARAYGVRSAMGIGTARKMCPGLIVVEGSFERYSGLSKQVFEICRRFTPAVEQISIDEAFLDVAGATHLFGPATSIAREVRKAVRHEAGLPISVGVARTKFLAKVASRMAKPDGLVAVDPERELEFLHPLPATVIWGVGPVTMRKLAAMGIATVGDLAATAPEVLAARLGPGAGRHLHALAWNRDPRRVVTTHRAGSISAQSAFGDRVTDRAGYAAVLARLADRVGGRLRRKNRAGRTITLKVRTGPFGAYHLVTRSRTLKEPVASTAILYRAASELLDGVITSIPDLTPSLLGIAVSKLTQLEFLQLELPLPGLHLLDDPSLIPGTEAQAAREELDRSVDRVRDRFGKDAIGPASTLLGRHRPAVPVAFSDLLVTDESSVDDAQNSAGHEDRTYVEAHPSP